ncbi:MAG: FkbM family methyltransferase [Verrucomicrobiae bacterium]|nr:FkbM family methyltransferase [Verrucomicrobiae bacterium]
MVRPVLLKLWHTSPATLFSSISGRIASLKRRSGWQTIQNGPLRGVELCVPARSTRARRKDSWDEMLAGELDSFIFSTLQERIQLDGKICWDVGSFIGYHAMYFAALGAEVTAFEPNPVNFAMLRLHLERNPTLGRRIEPLQVALCDNDGEMDFLQSSNIGGASSGSHLTCSLPPLPSGSYSGFQRSKVLTRRIDTLINSGHRNPDLIKIDVEGAELHVLKGGNNFFKNASPLLVIEVHHIRLMFEIHKLLSEWGYNVEILDKAPSEPSRCHIIAARK